MYENLKTINDLLEWNGYPVSYVQGHHTRIIKSDSGEFQTLGKNTNGDFSSYTKVLYAGFVEEDAVKAFIEGEIN